MLAHRIHIPAVFCLFLLAAIPLAAQPAPGKMTLENAMKRAHPNSLPPFWATDYAELTKRLDSLSRGAARKIGTSAGGHPLYVVEYGAREDTHGAANFNSAVGGRDLAAYCDKSKRTKPVILWIGPVHGHETEGLVGLRNLIEVLETGKDLLDREQPELRALADQCRLLIVPSGNPDALVRFTPRTLNGMIMDDARFWGQGTWADGAMLGWPEVKQVHPIPKDKTAFLGLYFTDAGVNIMHDEFFGGIMTPETQALLDLARDAAPDIAVSLHAYEGNPMIEKPTYVPTEIQQAAQAIDQKCILTLKERKLPYGEAFRPQPEGGIPPLPFSLVSALYHVSGAVAFVHECPHGLNDVAGCKATLKDILDIEFILYATTMEYAITNCANAPAKP